MKECSCSTSTRYDQLPMIQGKGVIIASREPKREERLHVDMEFRRLGRSGLTVSAIACGNWLTHGARIDEQARACVHAGKVLYLGVSEWTAEQIVWSPLAEGC